MSADKQDAEILRLARLLAKAIELEGEGAANKPSAGRGEHFDLSDLEAQRRVITRLRAHVESATAKMEMAIEDVEILAAQFGL